MIASSGANDTMAFWNHDFSWRSIIAPIETLVENAFFFFVKELDVADPVPTVDISCGLVDSMQVEFSLKVEIEAFWVVRSENWWRYVLFELELEGPQTPAISTLSFDLSKPRRFRQLENAQIIFGWPPEVNLIIVAKFVISLR